MKNDIVKRAAGLFTPALFFHTQIIAKRTDGVYVYGTDGKRYLDFSSGLATTNVGHCQKDVIRAAKAQMERLVHAGCIFYYDSEVALAERLRRITPPGIDMFFFSNSGAEAVEGAIKLARYATKRQGVIAFHQSFHGRTYGALSLTSSTSRYRTGYHPLLPSVYHAPYPYCYRCPMEKSRSTCDVDCFKYLKRVMRYQISAGEVACVIIEPVLGEGGYFVPPVEYMQRLRRMCDEEGILLIADEVQTGFGRTGRWFACEHFDIKPDIITMAKGIANGFPLSAVGSSRKIMSKWPPGAHGTTFGGNPVSCAAACAVVDLVDSKKLLENAAALGSHALSRLVEMKKRNKCIGDARGLGLMIGVEFVNPDMSPNPKKLKSVMERCLKKGLITVECGADKNVARFMPPLTVTRAQVDEALDIFEEAL